MKRTYDFIIVGGGIIGLATAYKLQLKFPHKTIAILEKETKIGKHQTGRNSGVIHSGIYYTPNSFKARNCKNGREQLVEFAKKHNIDYDTCGKVIVATKKEEIPLLDIIYNKGIENGTPNISYLNSEETKEKEPFIKALKAIWVPTAGIINYVQVANNFVELITKINNKSRLITSCKVNRIIDNQPNRKTIATSQGDFNTEKLIFCTGLHSDRNAKKNKTKIDMQIVGFRGDYYKLTKDAEHKVKSLVYPVPDPKFPFLGVHFTKMIVGGIECGPNAVFSFKREGYSTTSFSFKDTFEALTYKGTWKLFFKHWRKGIDEYKRAFSKRLFVKELQKMMPSLTINDVEVARSGVRAQAVDFSGNMVDDFLIKNHNGVIHVLNAPSPAATACLAIADEIVSRALSFSTNSSTKTDEGTCCYHKG
ncbi:MAG TPA: L-2-hydroxyglutarate oxidase [Flavobacteriaceae bacterium]|nr:L-2-hydroxyglutarate oxidase [Flavobacteriaceae bacterium]